MCTVAILAGCTHPAETVPPVTPVVFAEGRGTLTVSVFDSVSRRPVAHGHVTLQRASVVFTSIETDTLAGLYAFPAIPNGRYHLQTAQIGYRFRHDSVTIRAGGADTVRIALSLDDCDIGCSVVVTHRRWWQFWRR